MTYLNEIEERERGKRERKEREEKERGKRKRKEKEEREWGLSLSLSFRATWPGNEWRMSWAGLACLRESITSPLVEINSISRICSCLISSFESGMRYFLT